MCFSARKQPNRRVGDVLTMTQAHELIELTAVEATALLKSGEISPLELVEASARRIDEVDGQLNALPTLCVDRALEYAKKMKSSGGEQLGPGQHLSGLPIAVKDLNPVQGVRCTYGSPIYSDFVPDYSDFMVEALERNGAVVIAKSNTPEFGAGASTFNEVFGKTRNPWNTTKSVAGSSGGSAAAVASGQVWLATGSDLGGSLRTPASFNSVVGLRPSPGRVPRGPAEELFDSMAVNGPMARNALDAALFLDAMSEWHVGDPLSLPVPALPFLDQVKQSKPPSRIGFSKDLGIVPVDKEVAEICEKAALAFESVGSVVEQTCPDFSEAIVCFQTLRAASYASGMADLMREHRDKLKPEVIWNIDKGLALNAEDIGRAQVARTRLYNNMVKYFETYDLLLCPTAIVPPFDVDIRYVEEVEGVKFDNYVHWIAITFAITLTSCPAVSVPAGFTKDGLPVGLQIIGPPRGDGKTLGAAHLLEQELNLPRTPIDPRSD